MEQYIVSARKYRPATFDMVVGQRALTTTLLNAIRTGKLAHAYLFCGPRGVGKTTCARIFAKTINCMNLGADGQPCCECESCRAFEEGRSMNIHELDAASNNSVDDIRELIDQVRIPPQVGRYKVFIIDEVHMLSQQAFNAFLKTLEEPPKYVIFILATTEKHKILPTILSRCQVYDFARITIQNTIDHLKYVAQKEGYNVEEEALSLIARKADGGMRDALSIFDQMVSFTQGNITYQSTLENLNILNSEYYFRLVDHMLNKEVEASLLLFNEVVEKGFDGGNFIAGLASHLRNLLVSRDARTLPLLEVGEAQRQRYHEQALRCRPQFLYRTIKLCNDCDLGYRQSRNKRLQVEICLIQAAQGADDDGDGAGRRPAKILKPLFKQLTAPRAEAVATAQHPGAGSPAAGTAATAPRTPSIPDKKITPAAQPAAKPKETIALSLSSISIRNVRANSPQQQTAPTVQQPSPAQVPSSAKAGHLDNDNLILYWQQYANSLPQSEVATAQRMRGITPELVSPEEFVVTVNNPLIEKQLLKMQKSIEDHFCRQLNGCRVSMKVRVIEVEIAVKSYNKTEQFQQLLRENPNFAKLHEEFVLELN